MAGESPLRYPSVIYKPFDKTEVARLGKYRALVNDLTESSFIKAAGDISLTMGVEAGADHADEELTYPGEEAVRSALTLFRELYLPNEQCSFDATVNMLSAHVHERPSALQEQAKIELRSLKKLKGKSLQVQGLGMTLNGWKPNPSDIIDLFFNAQYFHSDHERAGLLGSGIPEAVLRFEFLTTVVGLERVFRLVVRLSSPCSTSRPFSCPRESHRTFKRSGKSCEMGAGFPSRPSKRGRRGKRFRSESLTGLALPPGHM